MKGFTNYNQGFDSGFNEDFNLLHEDMLPLTNMMGLDNSLSSSTSIPVPQDLQHGTSSSTPTGMSPSKSKRNRATGETLDLLKHEFSLNPSPSIQQRRNISKMIGMPEKNVTIWFQNRRAKNKKKMHAKKHSKLSGFVRRKSSSNNDSDDDDDDDDDDESGSDQSSNGSAYDEEEKLKFFDRLPLDVNKDYYLIDICSITVGSWNRMKSGSISQKKFDMIQNLRNLSPNSLSNIMNDSTDLIVLISKKNFEVNYFFSAVSNKTKILFRIFYPIQSVTNCSLSLESEDDITSHDKTSNFGELKLTMEKPPNFAVQFTNTDPTLEEQQQQTPNQWSICEDFSEGKQVNDAFIGGSNLPHCLKGLQNSLRFMNALILDYKSSNQIIQPPSFPLNNMIPNNTPFQQKDMGQIINSNQFQSYPQENIPQQTNIQQFTNPLVQQQQQNLPNNQKQTNITIISQPNNLVNLSQHELDSIQLNNFFFDGNDLLQDSNNDNLLSSFTNNNANNQDHTTNTTQPNNDTHDFFKTY